MTRIFDALRKAEAGRETPVAPVPLPTVSRSSSRGGSVARTAMPLLGTVELGEDVVRAMATLRVSLEAALRDRPSRTVLFVGPQGGEGASTVALQFAQVLARDTRTRPLLIDCHVRRPAYEPDETGRCAVLDHRLMSGPAEQSAVVSPNLFVVPLSAELRQAGMIQPTELRELLDANITGFDWVVLDGPPVLDAPDSASLGSMADGVVMVLQAGRTKRPVLTRAADLLAKSGSRLLGSVLNRRVLEIPEFIYRRI